MVKVIFCAHCQAETPHTVEHVGSELVAHCHCGLFWKFPVTTDAHIYTQLIATISRSNQGQVPAVEFVVNKDALSALENA